MSNKSPSQFTSPRAYHQPSHSASAVDTHPYPHSNNDSTTETGRMPQSPLVPANPHPPTNCLPLSRSRTPDPVSDDPTVPLDHISLSRFPTAPAPEAESFSDISVTNGKYDPATRHTTSTRMGFSAKEGPQPIISLSVSPRGQEQKSRFGIKSFFKAKS